MKIALYGFGAFNSAMAHYLERNTDAEIMFWEYDDKVIDYFKEHKSHPYHFVDKKFSRVKATKDLEELFDNNYFVIIAISAQHIRENAKAFKKYLKKPTRFLICSKGLEQGTMNRLSEVLEQELGEKHKIAVFSGGTTAADIERGIPLVAEVVSKDKETREEIAEVLHTNKIRIYTHEDLCSVEVAAALKNVVSFGAGICEGMGFDTGTIAALITRATYEIYKIAMYLGASQKAFLPGSASVWGDIMLSSFGKTRNREFGMRVAKGDKTPLEVLEEMKEEHKTVEGYYTVKSAKELSDEHQLNTPVIEELYSVAYEGRTPQEALKNLMERDRKELHPKGDQKRKVEKK